MMSECLAEEKFLINVNSLDNAATYFEAVRAAAMKLSVM
jgi:hypothetical protein